LVGKFVKLFDAIPISKTRAKDGMRVAAKALEDGAVVCIFPEGQLTRSGGMNAFQRGFEMMARRAKRPVLPAAMDGVWGSIFSFERNKFVYKKPYTLQYGVTVNFGEVLDTADANATRVRRRVESLRAEAFSERSVLNNPAGILSRKVKFLNGEHAGYLARFDELGRMSKAEYRELLANALQMSELNSVQRGQRVMIDWDALEDCRDVVAIVWALYLELELVLVGTSTTPDAVAALSKQYHVEAMVGGAALAEAWLQYDLTGEFYDFSTSAVDRVQENADRNVLPCLAHSGRVISMSVPHPAAQTKINDVQEGHRLGTWGRLLPGYDVTCVDSGVTLSGASAQNTIFLPGLQLNDEGMLILGEFKASSS